MSERTCQRCNGINKKGHRCKRRTCRTDLCYQHLKILEGLKIAKSRLKEAGLGLYTERPIAKNENVTGYTGERTTEGGPYVLEINSNLMIDAKKTNSAAGRYVNDCRAQNRRDGECRGNNTRFSFDYRNMKANVKATRNISPGEEIYVPYSRAYWN
jgi:hypothetical protein